MRNLDYLNSLPIEEKIHILRKLRVDVKKFESIDTNDETVKSTCEKFIKSLGRKRSAIVVASLVNECAWDGRICTASRNWAKRVEGAWDSKAMNELRVSSTMHPAHLDQIAYTMANMGLE